MILVHVEAEKNIKTVVGNKNMNRDDALTLKAVVLYILKNCSAHVSRNIYHIVKTAFLAHQKHLAKYLCPMYEDKFVALQFGPVPSNIYDALKIARGDANTMYFHRNDDLHLVYDSVSFKDEFYTAKEEPDINFLSTSAIECLNQALEEVSGMNFDQIMNATHGAEWTRVYNNPDLRFMNYLAIAQEGGADDSAISYLKENQEIDDMLK
ncbi:MAG: Panacea domain-containing protein [Bacteroidales bacterium]|jgi:uncharacterized phage-associated protein